MKKIVFVCRGNMFRSQIAQAIFNTNPIEGWKAFSSGTAVQEENRQGIKLSEWGGGMDIVINKVKEKYGRDISSESCKQVEESFVAQADKIIMMSEREYIPQWLNNYRWEYWQIPNPDIITPDITDEVMGLLDEKIAALRLE